jgi:hypothetical protein
MRAMSWFRKLLGRPAPPDFVDSTQDEQDLTNFRVLTDYVAALLQSWTRLWSRFQNWKIWVWFGAWLTRRRKD